MTLTFDLLTLKAVSKSRVTWATSVPILVFLGLSILALGPMYATDVRQMSDRQTSDKSIANCPRLLGQDIITRGGPVFMKHRELKDAEIVNLLNIITRFLSFYKTFMQLP